MDYSEQRRDAPGSREDVKQPQESEKQAKSEKPSDDSEYTFRDWASI